MGLSEALDISASGLEAQRRTLELVASNLANINTTRTLSGGPYRRKVSVLGEKGLSFSNVLAKAQAKLFSGGAGGVEVLDVVEDQTPFQKVYNPGHPDADPQGYVSMPNVNLANEMVDMVYVSKLYDANITAFNSTRKMIADTLTIQ